MHLGQNDEGLLRIVANRVEVEAHREPKIVLSVVISGIRILIGKRQGSDSVRGLVRWMPNKMPFYSYGKVGVAHFVGQLVLFFNLVQFHQIERAKP